MKSVILKISLQRKFSEISPFLEDEEFETGFLCSFGVCPGTPSVDQAGLTVTEISVCLCLPSAGIKGMHHHYPAERTFKIRNIIFVNQKNKKIKTEQRLGLNDKSICLVYVKVQVQSLLLHNNKPINHPQQKHNYYPPNKIKSEKDLTFKKSPW